MDYGPNDAATLCSCQHPRERQLGHRYSLQLGLTAFAEELMQSGVRNLDNEHCRQRECGLLFMKVNTRHKSSTWKSKRQETTPHRFPSTDSIRLPLAHHHPGFGGSSKSDLAVLQVLSIHQLLPLGPVPSIQLLERLSSLALSTDDSIVSGRCRSRRWRRAGRLHDLWTLLVQLAHRRRRGSDHGATGHGACEELLLGLVLGDFGCDGADEESDGSASTRTACGSAASAAASAGSTIAAGAGLSSTVAAHVVEGLLVFGFYGSVVWYVRGLWKESVQRVSIVLGC